jgi:DnaK suppressor protein
MLTNDELQGLRVGLMRRLTAVRGQIGDEVVAEAGERYRDMAGEVTDSCDEAVAAELAGTDNAIIGHNVDDVRDAEAALQRIADGRYGRCIGCGADIEYARLAACPTCSRCEQCQAIHEKTFAGARHPSL